MKHNCNTDDALSDQHDSETAQSIARDLLINRFGLIANQHNVTRLAYHLITFEQEIMNDRR